MSRLRNAIVAALFGAYVIGFVALVSWSSSRQPSNAHAAKKSSESNQAQVEHGSFGDWITHDAAGFFALWLVIVGAGQAGLFFWQLRYMRKSISDTKALALAAQASAETAKEQVAITKMGIFDLERAYLDAGPNEIVTRFVTDPPPVRGFYKPGDPMEVVIKIGMKNSGRTRAAINRAYGEFFQGNLGERPTYNFEAGITYVTDLSVAADEAGDFPHDFRTRRIGEQFFFGFIEYKDIFKKIHTSRFCLMIIPSLENGKRGKMQFAGRDAWRECD